MTDLEIIINAILFECDKVVKIINDDLHSDSLWFYEDVSKQRSWKRKFSMLMGGDAWDEVDKEAECKKLFENVVTYDSALIK